MQDSFEHQSRILVINYRIHIDSSFDSPCSTSRLWNWILLRWIGRSKDRKWRKPPLPMRMIFINMDRIRRLRRGNCVQSVVQAFDCFFGTGGERSSEHCCRRHRHLSALSRIAQKRFHSSSPPAPDGLSNAERSLPVACGGKAKRKRHHLLEISRANQASGFFRGLAEYRDPRNLSPNRKLITMVASRLRIAAQSTNCRQQRAPSPQHGRTNPLECMPIARACIGTLLNRPPRRSLPFPTMRLQKRQLSLLPAGKAISDCLIIVNLSELHRN